MQRGAQLLVIETTVELRHRRLRQRRPLSDFAQEDAGMDATWQYVYPFNYWMPESRNELGTGVAPLIFKSACVEHTQGD